MACKLGRGPVEQLIETITRYWSRYPLAERVLMRLPAMLLAIFFAVCAGQSALALDCLKYKPVGARGDWHADVVAGKICWFGPNWRAFLPKPKVRVEDAKAVTDGPGATARPGRPAQPAPSPVAASDAPPDLNALRKATPAEAAALINAISLEFDPAPSDPPPPPPASAPKGGTMTGIIIVAWGLAICGLAAAMIIYIRRLRRAKQRIAIGTVQQPSRPEQPRRQLAVTPRTAPPLQPFAIETDLQDFTGRPAEPAAYDHK
jgi:hypothetical protein